MGRIFDYLTMGPTYREFVKLERKSNKRAQSLSLGGKSAYDVERKAEEMNGDANYILYKAEEKIYKKINSMEKQLNELRKHENITLAKVKGSYDSTKNYSLDVRLDREFITDIKCGNFYSEYDGEPFTLKGLFTRSYDDACQEAIKAECAARVKKAKAQAISSIIDSMILKLGYIDQMMESEHKVLANFEKEIYFDSHSAEWLEKLIETAIGNADLTICKEHEKALEELKKIFS